MYRTNPSLQLRFSSDAVGFLDAWVYDPTSRTYQSVPIDAPKTVELLTRCDEFRSRAAILDDIRETFDASADESERRFESLRAERLLLTDSKVCRHLETWEDHHWKMALEFYLRARSFDATSVRSTDERPVTDYSAESGRANHEQLLPPPAELPDASLEGCLLARRTCRRFEPHDMTATAVSSLLYHGFEPMRTFRRRDDDVETISHPVAAHFGINVYVLVVRNESLNVGLYEYAPVNHELRPVDTGFDGPEPVTETLSDLLYDQPYVRNASLCVWFTLDFETYARLRPNSVGLRELYANVSSHAHRLTLVATAYDFGVFQSAAIKDGEADDLLGLDGEAESVGYLLAIGERDSASKASWTSTTRETDEL